MAKIIKKITKKKRTVKQLEKELEMLKRDNRNIQIASHCVWNMEQLIKVIEEADVQNGIVKVEIVHGFSPGKKCYIVQIWHWPKLLN